MNGEARAPYALLLDAGMLMPPGGSGGVQMGLPDPRWLFKITHAERVAGIDYSAWKVASIWVAQHSQWIDTTKDPVPAERLFEFDVPMETLFGTCTIVMQIINVSDKPQPFAIKFGGELLR